MIGACDRKLNEKIAQWTLTSTSRRRVAQYEEKIVTYIMKERGIFYKIFIKERNWIEIQALTKDEDIYLEVNYIF